MQEFKNVEAPGEGEVAYRDAVRRKAKDPAWDGVYAVIGDGPPTVLFQLQEDGTAKVLGVLSPTHTLVPA
jgi:hypothetical protein